MAFGNNVYNTKNSLSATSWTPELSFNIGTTGITYTSRSGSYQRIGNIIFYTFSIVLSNKGSSVGVAAITGLPTSASSDAGPRGVIAIQQNLTLNAGYSFAYFEPNPFNLYFQLYQTGPTTATGSTNLTDVNFANNTYLVGSGFYFV